MKKILEYLKLEKLGTPVLPPFKEFEGLVAAKVSRRNSESFVAAKWNPEFLCPDVAFDPNTSMGQVDEFLELYASEAYSESDFEEDVDSDLDADEDDFDDDYEEELIIDEPDGNFELDECDDTLDYQDIDTESCDSDKENDISDDKETYPIFESLTSQNLSKWLSERGVVAKMTLSKEEKVKLCEKYVADLEKSE